MADLRSVADLAGRDLRWIKFNGYQLRDGDDVVATLRFRSIWGSLATAESADGCWTFKRVGFLQTRATIRTCESEDEIAVFKNNSWTGGGTLELSSNVEILPAGAAFAGAPWLVMLGWYLSVQMHNDAAASASGAGAAT